MNAGASDGARTVLIVAGGTGGHIFPALAFRQWIERERKAERITCLSGSRPLEAEIYASRGVVPERLFLSGSPLGSSSILKNLWRVLEFFLAFFRAGRLMRRLRPDRCYLFGGYISLAPLLWCRILKIPTVIHEQNACAGKATRLASRMGVPVAAGWKECRGLKVPFVTTGIPVRRFSWMNRRDAARALGIEVQEDDLVIGVIGGSLSSAALNALSEKLFRSRKETSPEKLRPLVFAILGDSSGPVPGASVHFLGRRWDMSPFYSLVDAVICRSGASTLAELALYGIPALTIPWKDAADGHQEANARCFAAISENLVWYEEENTGPEDAFSKLLTLCLRKKTPRGEISADDRASRTLWKMGTEL
ncbi:MAG: UDP-N-acetylglucosamine--N-acetylmuramyl-(pentapeptide) pyrophosphoryl-undecaprenol N-acetylglucosamine transferase [Synergistaceae bacterium]|jgi:UDP-N-acetylglucosamine--N-acetylmuramyl-(pentapeptide) pyrophosphoryl-undecaprenol N-acetylglucosamine transferase|nr:UDP-N-acetylglucosamine--N-acetylmuramyl-(pentapeptide) pyrophosphoryl-undecaprenol N-acetylglucosamine transferase [Synergistaceae bacterium]